MCLSQCACGGQGQIAGVSSPPLHVGPRGPTQVFRLGDKGHFFFNPQNTCSYLSLLIFLKRFIYLYFVRVGVSLECI